MIIRDSCVDIQHPHSAADVVGKKWARRLEVHCVRTCLASVCCVDILPVEGKFGEISAQFQCVCEWMLENATTYAEENDYTCL